MRRVLLGVAASAAVAGPCAAQIVINVPPTNAGHPWTVCGRRPASSDISQYVPAKAKRAGVSGTVDLQCKVSASARTVACTWIKESPRGYGFGPAAARYGCLLRVPPRFLTGVGPGGARVNTTLRMRPTRAY